MARRKKAYCLWCRRDLLDVRALDKEGKPHGRAFTRDHLYPQSLGGKKWYPCCRACNQVKADLTPQEWDAFRARYPRWWQFFPLQNARTIRGWQDGTGLRD